MISTNLPVLIGSFTTQAPILYGNVIGSGIWDLNLYVSTNSTNQIDMYWAVSYVNGGGSKVQIASGIGNPGNGTSITNFSATTLIRNELYVPFTVVPSVSTPVVIDIYTIIKGGNTNNKTVTLYFNKNSYYLI